MEAKTEHGQQATRRLRLSGGQPKASVKVSDRWQQTVATAFAVLTLALLLSLFGRWAYDDPYITFRYAGNLLAGNGFVYNVGQRTLSTTAPLYGLLLAGLGLAWPDLPVLSNTLSALSLIFGASFLYGWARGNGEKATGMLAGLLLCLWPLLFLTFGSEACFSIMLVLGGLWAYDSRRYHLAAITLAVAAMVRPDGVMAAVAVGMVHLARRQPIPWRPVILYLGLVGMFYGGIWLYFGSPVPITLLAKQQQGQMASSMRFGAGFLDLVRQYGRLPLFWLHGALALVGLWQIVTRRRHWIPLLTWTALYFLAYAILRVSRYYWYYAPLVPALVVLVAEGAVVVSRSLARIRLSRQPKTGLVALFLATLLVPVLTGIIWTGWHSDPRYPVYRETGQWIGENTPPGASVGALEVGIVGYYAQRPIVDFAGLIQPAVARQFTPATTYQDAATWTIQTYRPEYVLLHKNAFPSLAGSDWFQSSYQPVRDFTSQRATPSLTQEAPWLTLYHRDGKEEEGRSGMP